MNGLHIIVHITRTFEDSEAVNWRTDNTMATRKRRKGQTMIYKTQQRKLKIV